MRAGAQGRAEITFSARAIDAYDLLEGLLGDSDVDENAAKGFVHAAM